MSKTSAHSLAVVCKHVYCIYIYTVRVRVWFFTHQSYVVLILCIGWSSGSMLSNSSQSHWITWLRSLRSHVFHAPEWGVLILHSRPSSWLVLEDVGTVRDCLYIVQSSDSVASSIDSVFAQVCHIEASWWTRDQDAQLTRVEHLDPWGMEHTP